MPPSGSVPPSLTKAFRPAEYKVMETGSKNSSSGSFGMIVKMPLLFLPSILGPINSDLEKQHYMLDTDLEPAPRPEKYCHLASIVIECSKGHATILSGQQLQYAGE